MAESFKNSPVFGDIVDNHLKDFRLSAFNMSDIADRFQKDTLASLTAANEFIEEHKDEVTKLSNLKIKDAFPDSYRADKIDLVAVDKNRENLRRLSDMVQEVVDTKMAGCKIKFFPAAIHGVYVKYQRHKVYVDYCDTFLKVPGKLNLTMDEMEPHIQAWFLVQLDKEKSLVDYSKYIKELYKETQLKIDELDKILSHQIDVSTLKDELK